MNSTTSQQTAPMTDPATDGTAATSTDTGAAVPPPVYQAENLREMAGAGWLYWIISATLSEQLDPDAFKVYRDVLLKEAGNPTDPIEIMLIEQLALSHFSIGRLHVRSCSTDIPKMALAFEDAATRLLGEFRRCTLALEDLRAKRAARMGRDTNTDKVEVRAKPRMNERPRISANRKKMALIGKLGHNRIGEIPAWLNNRMAYPTQGGSKLVAATSRNGKG